MRLGTAARAQPPASCCSSIRALAGHRLGALRAAPLRAPRVCVGVMRLDAGAAAPRLRVGPRVPPARSRAGRRLLATELPATCRWGTGPAALASTRARGCACRSAAGAGRSAASRALQAAGACASGPCGRQLMRSAPAAALWRHRGPSRRRRVRSSRARLRRGGPAVVLSGHTHGHTHVSAPSILGFGFIKDLGISY